MMCFEVVFPIIVAFFAVFGLYSLICRIGETWFTSDNITVCIEVDTAEVSTEIDRYLKEAGRIPIAHGGQITVLVRPEYADEALLRKLRRRHIRCFVLDMENRVD